MLLTPGVPVLLSFLCSMVYLYCTQSSSAVPLQGTRSSTSRTRTHECFLSSNNSGLTVFCTSFSLVPTITAQPGANIAGGDWYERTKKHIHKFCTKLYEVWCEAQSNRVFVEFF